MSHDSTDARLALCMQLGANLQFGQMLRQLFCPQHDVYTCVAIVYTGAERCMSPSCSLELLCSPQTGHPVAAGGLLRQHLQL